MHWQPLREPIDPDRTPAPASSHHLDDHRALHHTSGISLEAKPDRDSIRTRTPPRPPASEPSRRMSPDPAHDARGLLRDPPEPVVIHHIRAHRHEPRPHTTDV